MSEAIHVTATISPAPGKEARVQELLEAITKQVHAHELGCTKYHVNKAKDSTDFIVIETYQNQEAFEAHAKSPGFQALVKAFQEEKVVSKSPSIIQSTKVSGFESR